MRRARAFDGWDPEVIAAYGEDDIARLMADAGIVRNRLKIQSAITNARCFLAVQDEFGSFADYLWGHVDGAPVVNRFRSMKEVPAKTELSDRISKDLLKRGFKFVGSTIVYAYLQAMGVVNDHVVDCHRHLARPA